MDLGERRRTLMKEFVHDYSKDYLTIEILSSGTLKFQIDRRVTTTNMTSLSYSLNGGQTWTKTYNANDITKTITVNVSVGDKVLWKGNGSSTTSDAVTGYESRFITKCNFNVYGNVLSLLYEDNFVGKTTFPSGSKRPGLNGLFRGCTNLQSAKNLILPLMTLTNSCYKTFFRGCTSLIDAPKLPATTLAEYCYAYFFDDCTSLTTIPSDYLPVTTMTQGCYDAMFNDCTALITAPELPATTLANFCYQGMFYGCTSLTAAPELPATKLATQCYYWMFYGCTNLNYIKAMFTTTPSNSCTEKWVYGVASSGTFVKNSSATWNVTGTNGVPSGWTVQTATS